MYTVEFTHSALKDLAKLPKHDQKRVFSAIEKLKHDSRPRGVIKLKGSEHRFRLRVGHFRVIFQVFDDRLLVLVVKVKHRREAY